MSASTVARWNSIPMNRPEQDTGSENDSHKRTRPDDDDESSEDNVSIVSRSPSPRSGMDIDEKDINTYDDYHRGSEHETINVHTKIKSTNKGFALLAKMGWKDGQPLGISGEGRVEPVGFVIKNDQTGLGKSNQDFRMIETTVSQRRFLDSERMRNETEEQRKARQESVAQKAAVQSEITNVLKPFYCQLCDKQFQNVAQYDEHTNSYAHHHKARMKDMQANHPLKQFGKEEMEKRKEKERRREAKELKKLAAAVGVKLVAPTPHATHAESGEPIGEKGFKKAGWASVSSAETSTSGAGSRGGWAVVGSPSNSSTSATNQLSSAPAFRTGGWTSLADSITPHQPPLPPPVPENRGWSAVQPSLPPPPPSSLSPPIPPPSALSHPTPPPPPPASLDPTPQRSGWNIASAPSPSQPPPPPSRGGWSSGGFNSVAAPPPSTPLGASDGPHRPPPPPAPTLSNTTPAPSPSLPPPSAPGLKSKTQKKNAEVEDRTRGNWQQFQKGRRK